MFKVTLFPNNLIVQAGDTVYKEVGSVIKV